MSEPARPQELTTTVQFSWDTTTWDTWGHYHVMLGLLLWHEATGDPGRARRFGDLFCNRFLGEKRPRLVDTGSTEMNLAPAHGLLPAP